MHFAQDIPAAGKFAMHWCRVCKSSGTPTGSHMTIVGVSHERSWVWLCRQIL